ncbi:MAG: hypothetical protein NTX49_00565 [Chlamydiae bacterium]|nr:hypothetical protein [Chlamydiota bacterium]
MTSPTNLSHTPSIVSQRVITPVEGSERTQPSPLPRVPSSPVHRMTSDVLQSAAAFASSAEGLSFALPRSPSLEGNALDLSHDHTALVGSGDVEGLIGSAPLPPQSEKKATLSIQRQATDCFATLCDRISAFITDGVTRFVNWIASWFCPSSVAEDLSSLDSSSSSSSSPPPVADSDALDTGVASRAVSPQALVSAETSAFVAVSSSTPPLVESAVLETAAASRAVSPQPLVLADSATLETVVSSL